MKDSRLIQENFFSSRVMAIIEKYEDFLNYIYPIAQNIPRVHSVFRDMLLKASFRQVELFTAAGKSSYISKLHAADANLASLRFYLRFMVKHRIKLTPAQHRVASGFLAEAGGMLNSWMKSVEGKKG